MNQKQILLFEVMDRAHVQATQLEGALGDHEGLTKKTSKKLTKAIDALNALYQTASSEFHDEKWRPE